MPLFATLLALLAIGAATPAFAAADTSLRPITHEDLWLMKRISAPVLSPDGRLAVFTLAEPAYSEDDKASDLWLVAVDGSAPARRLTASKAGESGVAWSPDGGRIAFSAKREGDLEAQVYVLDVRDGGEAQRVTRSPTGAATPRWRPDGKAILFSSRIFPGAADEASNELAVAERKARKYNARAYESFPIRHWDRWLDDRQPTLMLQDLEAGGAARDLLAGTALVRLPGFGGSLGNEGESLPAAWSPDGSTIVFVATGNRHQSAHADVVMSLYSMPAAGGEPHQLTGPEANYASPAFAADGSALFARATPNTKFVYNDTRLVRFDWGNHTSRSITDGFKRSVDSFALSPDGQQVFLVAEDAGSDKIYTVAANGGEVRQVGTLTSGSYGSIEVAGGSAPVLVTTWESATQPAEIVRVDAASGDHQALTAFNAAAIAGIDLPPVQEFWFTSKRGRKIHNLLVLPPGFDPAKKYPLFVLIHGGPHGVWKDQFVLRWNYHLLASPGYVMLMTNYSGSTGFGEAFAQGIQGDPLRGPANEINQAADEALRRYAFIDAERQVAGGASYGGHLANWLAVTTDRYKALVSHAGLFDLKTQWTTSDVAFSREQNLGGPPWKNLPVWRDQSPFTYTTRLKTPILVTFGEKDFRVPVNNGLEFWTLLKRQQVPSRLVIFPDENHWILKGENSRYFYQEVHGWVARYLAPAGSNHAAK